MKEVQEAYLRNTEKTLASHLVMLSYPKHSVSMLKPEKSGLPPRYEVVLTQFSLPSSPKI